MSESILEEAQKIIHGPRREDYGTPLENHTRTAEMFSNWLSRRYPGIQLTAEDVCFFNIIQKVSRAANKPTRDGLVDIAGYAGNIELIWDEQAKK